MKHGSERRKLDIGRRPIAQHVTYKLFNHSAGFQRVPVCDLLKSSAVCRAGKRGVITGLANYSQLFDWSRHRAASTFPTVAHSLPALAGVRLAARGGTSARKLCHVADSIQPVTAPRDRSSGCRGFLSGTLCVSAIPH